MTLADAYDGNGGWIMNVHNKSNGSTTFEIAIKEAPRRWRRENITLSKSNVAKLALYLNVENEPGA